MPANRYSVFSRQILANFLVCVLIVALIVPLCVSFYNTFYHRQEESFQNALQVMLDDINTNMALMRNLVSNIEINDSLQSISIIRGQPSASDTSKLRKGRNYMTVLAQSNPYIADCVLAFEKNNLILTKNSVYYSLEEFSRFNQLEGADFSAWLQELHLHESSYTFLPVTRITYIETTHASSCELAFCYGIPVNSIYLTGEFFLFVYEDALLQKLPSAFLEYASFSLWREDGEAVYSYCGSQWREDESAIAFTLPGASGMLSLSATLNSRAISRMIASTRKLVSLYVCGAAAAAIGLAVYFTMRQFRPIRILLEQLRSFGYTIPQDERQLSFITRSIGDMQARHRDVLKMMAAYRAQLRDAQIERLLCMPYQSDMPVPDCLPPCYRIGYTYIATGVQEADSELLGTLIAEQLREMLPDNALILQMEDAVFVLIVPGDLPTERVSQMLSQINARLHKPLCMTLSELAQGPEHMHGAFESVRMRSLSQRSSGVLQLADSIPSARGVSMQSSMRLYQELMAGNAESACALISDAMRNSSPLFESVAELYGHFRLLIRFALQDAGLPETLAPAACAMSVSPKTMLSQLLGSIEAMCGARRAMDDAREAAMDADVLAYIEAHLNDSALNAEQIARAFALPERRIQAIARQEGATSLSAYLQRRRMALITELLAGTDLAVSEIGARAGYNTSSAFFKAFKRAYGISPSEYRSLHRV